MSTFSLPSESFRFYQHTSKGLSNAKREMQDMEEQGIVEFNHRFDDDLTCTTERMKLAIAQIDHLYQNNITKSE